MCSDTCLDQSDGSNASEKLGDSLPRIGGRKALRTGQSGFGGRVDSRERYGMALSTKPARVSLTCAWEEVKTPDQIALLNLKPYKRTTIQASATISVNKLILINMRFDQSNLV